MRVLWDGLVFPVWVHGTAAKLQVTKLDPPPTTLQGDEGGDSQGPSYVVLHQDARLIVAPRVRDKDAGGEDSPDVLPPGVAINTTGRCLPSTTYSALGRKHTADARPHWEHSAMALANFSATPDLHDVPTRCTPPVWLSLQSGPLHVGATAAAAAAAEPITPLSGAGGGEGGGGGGGGGNGQGVDAGEGGGGGGGGGEKEATQESARDAGGTKRRARARGQPPLSRVIVRLKHSAAIPPGHIVVSDGVRALVGMGAFSNIGVKLVEETPTQLGSVAFHPCFEARDAEGPACCANQKCGGPGSAAAGGAAGLFADVEKHVLEWLDTVEASSPVRVVDRGPVQVPFPPAIISRTRAPTGTTHLHFTVVFPKRAAGADAGGEAAAGGEAVPAGGDQDTDRGTEYCALFCDCGTKVQLKRSGPGSPAPAKAKPFPCPYNQNDAGVIDFVGLGDQVSSLWGYVSSMFGRRPTPTPLATQATQAAAPSYGTQFGGAIITGPRGVGKTALIDAVCIRAQWDLLLHVQCLDFRTLKNRRPDVVRRILRGAFVQAKARQPSILMLDHIDEFLGAGGSDEQQRSDAGDRSEEFAEYLHQLTEEYYAKQSRILVLAVANSTSGVHPTVLDTWLCEFNIKLECPNAEQRVLLLQHYMRRSGVSESALGIKFTKRMRDKMEGSVCRDMNQLVRRAIHQASLRASGVASAAGPSLQGGGATPRALPTPEDAAAAAAAAGNAIAPGAGAGAGAGAGEGGPADGGARPLDVRLQDFEAALVGFVPSALQDVALHQSITTFADIGGLGDAKEHILDTFMWPSRYPKLFASCPLRLRSGIMLYGPPGCGKTMLAGAIAIECGLRFISVAGPELLNKYIGASEQAVRDLFARAHAASPSILFFDEFDSIAPRRGADSTGVTDRVVNQLLTQLDGVEGLEGVYVLAATSRPELIDPALLRPGRFDKSILCGMPTADERQCILEAHAKKLALGDDAVLEPLAEKSQGYSGADLKAVLSNAQIAAVRESARQGAPLARLRTCVRACVRVRVRAGALS